MIPVLKTMRDPRKIVLTVTFLLASGAGCASTHQKADMPLIEGGPGENLKRLTALMQTPSEGRRPDIPSPERSASPSSGEGGPGDALRQLITLMQTPSGQHPVTTSAEPAPMLTPATVAAGELPTPGAGQPSASVTESATADPAASSSVNTTHDASGPPDESPPPISSHVSATALTPAALPVGSVEGSKDSRPPASPSMPKEDAQTPGTSQPSGAPLETAALSPPVPRPAPPDSLRSGVGSLSSDRSYRLGPEDVVNVAVWGNKDLTMDVTVRPDGRISLPLIKDIQAANLTPLELAGAITEKLRAYIKDPQVTVIVAQVVAPKIFILGNVPRPGTYPLRQEMTVLQALSLAGGFTTFASPRNITLLRSAGNGQEVRKIDYYKMIGEDAEGNHTLKPGDTIVVP